MPRRDEISAAVVEAARQLFADWARRGRDVDVIIAVNPMNRLLWRRWRVVEGLDVRAFCRHNPPPEGLTLGVQQAFQYPVRERQPFGRDWTPIEDLDSVVAKVERELTRWTTS